ncbi:MAG: hypothetical protein HPY64_13510 [Anaerolineae bacterium]|nr:hypothetical protein [Anaerolineae bacterium]
MRKSLAIVLVLSLLLVAGVVTVYAQGGTDGDDDATGVPPCWGWGGRGMMAWGGRGMMQWGAPPEDAPVSIVAEALGLEVSDLVEQLQDGKTVAEIAEAQGVALADVIEAVVAVRAEELAAAVEAGTLTQAQADAMQALLRANLEAHFTQGMPGPRGMMMGQGWGMMHQGRGMMQGRMPGGRAPWGMMEPPGRWGH